MPCKAKKTRGKRTKQSLIRQKSEEIFGNGSDGDIPSTQDDSIVNPRKKKSSKEDKSTSPNRSKSALPVKKGEKRKGKEKASDKTNLPSR